MFWSSSPNVSLPIAGKINKRAALQRQRRDAVHLSSRHEDFPLGKIGGGQPVSTLSGLGLIHRKGSHPKLVNDVFYHRTLVRPSPVTESVVLPPLNAVTYAHIRARLGQLLKASIEISRRQLVCPSVSEVRRMPECRRVASSFSGRA